MNDDFENLEFERKLHQQLRAGEDNIEPGTRAQLVTARHKALEQSSSIFARPLLAMRGSPAWGALAVAALIAVVVTQVYTPPAAPPATDLTFDQELELYENIEMLEFHEELEFYDWLETEISEEMST